MSVVNLDRGMREGESPSRCSRGISYVKPIGTAKVAVPVRALAENLCEGGLRRVGKELVGRCRTIKTVPPRSPSTRTRTSGFVTGARAAAMW